MGSRLRLSDDSGKVPCHQVSDTMHDEAALSGNAATLWLMSDDQSEHPDCLIAGPEP